MKILIFGGSGMLGHKLVQILQKRFDVWATFRSDFTNFQSIEFFNPGRVFANIEVEAFDEVSEILENLVPDVIINAAGVIKQLPVSKDVITTLKVNSIFPHQLAQAAQIIGSRLITISTDCVFSGRDGNYIEEDICDAEDLYGKSKNLGEILASNCLTLRTSIIGRELRTSHSLVEWFLSNRGGKVKGFTNAVYSGFPTIILVQIIADLIENHQSLEGLYHVSSNPISKYDLLELINAYYGLSIEIEPSGEFKIDRSLDSTKFKNQTGFVPLPWEKMIEIMEQDSTFYDNFRNR